MAFQQKDRIVGTVILKNILKIVGRGLDKRNYHAIMWWEVGEGGYIPLDKQSHPHKGGKMVTIIKNTELTRVAEGVKPDTKKRVVLPKALVKEGITYHVYTNSEGQIILDPQVTIPASELWLFKNKDILASVDRGMLESTRVNRGSFAKYIKNAP